MSSNRRKRKFKKAIRSFFRADALILLLLGVAFVGVVVVSIINMPKYQLQETPAEPTKVVTLDTPTPSPQPTATPLPKPSDKREILAAESTATTLYFQWIDVEADSYYVEYRAMGGRWMTLATKSNEVRLTGLESNASFEVRMQYVKDDNIREYISSFMAETEKTGYGDPFQGIGAVLRVDSEEQRVTFSSENGCLGAKVWPQFKTTLYQDSQLKEKKDNVAGGTAMEIAVDSEGRFCYLRSNGRWSIFAAAEDGTCGWLDADTVLIDLADLFPQDNVYAIRFDRTNAYSSIFTVGGDASKVQDEGDADSRYSFLNDKTTMFTANGINSLAGVTGKKLPNYGSKEQMPVIWCLAMELIQCQENALYEGCTLLIYDGYRPNSTSRGVNKTVNALGYLSKRVNSKNLANGYLSIQLYESNYIANTSKHNMGVAVDLTLQAFSTQSELGSELVMQTKMHTLDFRSNMQYNNDNSDLLYEVMTQDTHLVSLRKKQEWWHFELEEDVRIFPRLDDYIYADYEL